MKAIIVLVVAGFVVLACGLAIPEEANTTVLEKPKHLPEILEAEGVPEPTEVASKQNCEKVARIQGLQTVNFENLNRTKRETPVLTSAGQTVVTSSNRSTGENSIAHAHMVNRSIGSFVVGPVGVSGSRVVSGVSTPKTRR